VTVPVACNCFEPLVFGHNCAALGPAWIAEAADRHAERERRIAEAREKRARWAMEGAR
jgi:hypothetical protein